MEIRRSGWVLLVGMMRVMRVMGRGDELSLSRLVMFVYSLASGMRVLGETDMEGERCP